jgi:hypothetical protein
MARKLISSGSNFEAQIGYSRAVVAGDWVFVSGTTGFDYSTMSIADGLLEHGGAMPDKHRVRTPTSRRQLAGRRSSNVCPAMRSVVATQSYWASVPRIYSGCGVPAPNNRL